jgi:hypothetical protein
MTGELRRGTTIRGITGGTAEGTITTGGFAYDEDTLTGLVKEWLALADDYDNSVHNSQRLILVEGPGRDFASGAVAKAANSYGAAYLAYLKQNRRYCLDQAQLSQNALDDYLGIEHRNVEELYKITASDDVGSGQEI